MTDHAVSQAKAGRLVLIQYLRGIAAMMVVLHHALHARPGFFNPLSQEVDFGRPGVLIFFVISGFVIMHACRNEPPALFALRRIIRIVPLYWLLTLVFFAILSPNDLAAGDPLRRVGELVQSLLFIPHWHMSTPTEIWPILVPGWTLNYEMFFFVIFAIGIAAGRPAEVSIALLAALVLTGWALPLEGALWKTWTNAFLILFIAGILLAKVWQKRDFSTHIWMLPAGFGLVCLAALHLVPTEGSVPALFLGAVLTVAGTLAWQDRAPQMRIPLLGQLGDASYSFYLSHTILMIFLYKGLRVLPLSGWPQFILSCVLVICLCAAAGVLLYRTVEAPMTKALRRAFEKPKPIQGQPS